MKKDPRSSGTKRRLLVWIGVVLGLPAALYLFLFALNLVTPILIVVTPRSFHPTLFSLRLIGKTERAYYDSGRIRYAKRWLPTRINWIYGTTYVPYGRWESWNPSGERKAVLDWPDATGKWLEWRANGTLMSEVDFKNGKVNGFECWYWENGNLRKKGEYTDDDPCGTWMAWFENGQKKSEHHLRNGKWDGSFRAWYPDGAVREETEYKDGEPSGTWKSYSPSGEVTASLAFPGATGKWVSWYGNGQKQEEGVYLNGQKEGVWVSWHDNGKKSDEGMYLNGKEHGKWISWRYDGSIGEVEWYEHGQYDIRGLSRTEDRSTP